MSFDISRTETFIPFLWIFGKYLCFTILISLLSNPISNWSPHKEIILNDSRPMTDSYDRLIFIVVLQFVLFENKIDLYITKRNDTLFKNLNTVALNANINIFTDFFFAFVILSYNKKIRLDASTVLDYSMYGFYASQVA